MRRTKRYVLNNRAQEESKSIDNYVNALRTLVQSCNYCHGLHDSLLRERLVIGIRNSGTRKKLLQEKKLTLSLAVDICKSSEVTTMKLMKEKPEKVPG